MAKNILLTGALALGIAPLACAQQADEVRDSPTTASVYAQESISLLTGFETTTAGFTAEIRRPVTEAGRWSAPMLWTPYPRAGTGTPVTGLVGIHTHVTPDGKVLSWEGHNDNADAGHLSHAYVWNPNPSARNSTQSYPDVYVHYDNFSSNLFCSGHSFLANGRLLVAGGHFSDGPNTGAPDVPYNYAAYSGKYVGLKDLNTFNYAGDITAGRTYVWQSSAVSNVIGSSLPPATLREMRYRRWYPTVTTLADGRALVTAGQQFGDPTALNGTRQAENPEVYNAATDTWQELTGATRRLPTYPWMFQAPNGPVFNAGPNPDTQYLNVAAPNGAWGPTYPSQLNSERNAGTAVMYQPGKILIMGGENQLNGTITATTERIDLTATTPAWQTDAPMRHPRFHVNSTLLADGKVLVTGGNQQATTNDNAAALAAELWTPPAAGATGTGTWTTMNSMARPRLYHSTAVLLPDATVLSTGGGQGGNFTDHPDYEIFTPPYLCKGFTRPQIDSAPQAVAYGQSFTVNSPQASNILSSGGRVTLVRLSSVTHSFNMNQRFLELSPTAGSTSTALALTAPSDNRLCPPGHYMLFLIAGNGTPSHASIIAITAAVPCSPALQITQTPVAEGGQFYACHITTAFTVTGGSANSVYNWTVNGSSLGPQQGQITIQVVTDTDTPTAQVSVNIQGTDCGASSTLVSYFPACTTAN